MDDDFYRIRRLPPYVFAEVNAMKAAADAVKIGHSDSALARARAPRNPYRAAMRGS